MIVHLQIFARKQKKILFDILQHVNKRKTSLTEGNILDCQARA